MKKQIIAKNIILLEFTNQKHMAESFLRFQEFYESPKFRAKVFTHEEFINWYSVAYGNGEFTYCTDWNGFNFPSWIIKAFEHGLFNPLTDKEKAILKAVKDIPEPFYVIGALKEDKLTLTHEVAHGLFYSRPSYKAIVLDVLNNYNMKPLKKYLKSIGYCNEVLDDECQAFLISGMETSEFKSKNLKECSEELQYTFKQFQQG